MVMSEAREEGQRRETQEKVSDESQDEEVERLEVKTEKVESKVGVADKKQVQVTGCNKSKRMEKKKVKREEKRATRQLWPQAESMRRWDKRANRNMLPSSSSLPRLTTFNLPHQTHELNTADMNASKLEKVGIRLNHVANSANVTASFLFASLMTAEPNQTFS